MIEHVVVCASTQRSRSNHIALGRACPRRPGLVGTIGVSMIGAPTVVSVGVG